MPHGPRGLVPLGFVGRWQTVAAAPRYLALRQVRRTPEAETLLTESTPKYKGQRSPRPPCAPAWSVTGRPRGCQLVVVRGFAGAPVLHYVTRVDMYSVGRHHLSGLPA